VRTGVLLRLDLAQRLQPAALRGHRRGRLGPSRHLVVHLRRAGSQRKGGERDGDGQEHGGGTDRCHTNHVVSRGDGTRPSRRAPPSW
ncbi:hypothetical protein GAY30_34140, partial [Azospirillum brasilense]|nr:hypothetical protein [Azospirillum brasilense]